MKIDKFLVDHSNVDIRYKPVKYKEGKYATNVNGFSPIKIDLINQNLYDKDLIDIKDEANKQIGTLYLIKGRTETPTNMSDAMYAAYIEDMDDEIYGTSYTFKNNYLVILPGNIKRYMDNFCKDSIVWGGFSTSSSVSLPSPAKRQISSITALINVGQKHTYQYELLALAEQQPFAFERFLRYYHYFEYIFEAKIVEKIKSIPPNLDGYTGVIRELSKSNETDRLKSVILGLLDNSDIPKISQIFSSLQNLSNKQIAMDILFNYGKDFNPLKDKEDEFENLINSANFTPSGLLSEQLYKKIDTCEKIYFEFVCYVLYRVRCCIAHTKLSEYILKPSEESFVADFAEPIIRHCVINHAKT